MSRKMKEENWTQRLRNVYFWGMVTLRRVTGSMTQKREELYLAEMLYSTKTKRRQLNQAQTLAHLQIPTMIQTN